MNILDRLAREDEWISVVDCHLCNKETHIIPVDYEYFGVKGYMHVQVCKECYRESQLNKLL